MKRSIAFVLLGIGACAAMHSVHVAKGQTLTVTPRNSRTIAASTTDQNGANFNITGLSGLTHLGGGEYWAVMDNSNKLVHLQVNFDANGNTQNTTAVLGGLTIADTSDFEGIAFTNGIRNSVFLSEETTPGVREYSLTNGAHLQTLTTPAVYSNRVAGLRAGIADVPVHWNGDVDRQRRGV